MPLPTTGFKSTSPLQISPTTDEKKRVSIATECSVRVYVPYKSEGSFLWEEKIPTKEENVPDKNNQQKASAVNAFYAACYVERLSLPESQTVTTDQILGRDNTDEAHVLAKDHSSAKDYPSAEGYFHPEGYPSAEGYFHPEGYPSAEGYFHPEGYPSAEGYFHPEGYPSAEGYFVPTVDYPSDEDCDRRRNDYDRN